MAGDAEQDPTDAEEHKAQETACEQPAADVNVLDRVRSDFREPWNREGLEPPVPGHEHGADDRRRHADGAQHAGLASFELIDRHEGNREQREGHDGKRCC